MVDGMELPGSPRSRYTANKGLLDVSVHVHALEDEIAKKEIEDSAESLNLLVKDWPACMLDERGEPTGKFLNASLRGESWQLACLKYCALHSQCLRDHICSLVLKMVPDADFASV